MTARQKKLYKKRFLKTLVLMLALILTIGGLQRYVLCGNNQNGIRLRAFHKEDPGSLDVVLLGASEVYSGFGAGEFYKMTGVTSYPYTFESNPVTLWKYQLDEILRRKPDAAGLPVLSRYMLEKAVPAMNRLRECADVLETITDRNIWPFPTYDQLLFSV